MSSNQQAVPFRAALSSAIGYWERRRLLYNVALARVVAGAFVVGLPYSALILNADWIVLFFILAVLANVAYCAAYLPDVLAQLSSFRDAWLRIRWVVLTTGTLLAAAITYLVVAGPFGLADGNW